MFHTPPERSTAGPVTADRWRQGHHAERIAPRSAVFLSGHVELQRLDLPEQPGVLQLGDGLRRNQFVDVKRTLLPNDACGTSACNMAHCSNCRGRDGSLCAKCPCDNCIVEVNVTRNYTYTVAKKPQKDGTHRLIKYQWTQGIPFKKNGATPGIGRDCFIFDWAQDWTAEVEDSQFAPPPGLQCM